MGCSYRSPYPTFRDKAIATKRTNTLFPKKLTPTREAGCLDSLKRREGLSRTLGGCEDVERRAELFVTGSDPMLGLHTGWVQTVSGVRKVVPIAAGWPRMLVLDSSKRGLDHPLESPILVLRVILIIE
jgi:hypothetical protein